MVHHTGSQFGNQCPQTYTDLPGCASMNIQGYFDLDISQNMRNHRLNFTSSSTMGVLLLSLTSAVGHITATTNNNLNSIQATLNVYPTSSPTAWLIEYSTTSAGQIHLNLGARRPTNETFACLARVSCADCDASGNCDASKASLQEDELFSTHLTSAYETRVEYTCPCQLLPSDSEWCVEFQRVCRMGNM